MYGSEKERCTRLCLQKTHCKPDWFSSWVTAESSWGKIRNGRLKCWMGTLSTATFILIMNEKTFSYLHNRYINEKHIFKVQCYITTGLEWSWYALYITLRCYIKFPSFSFLWIKFDAFCEQLGFSFGTFGMALRLDGIPLRKFLLQWRWLVVVGETTGCLYAVRLWKSWKYKVYSVHTHIVCIYLQT